MDNIKRSIGYRIAHLRKDSGLTQAELSAMIDINEKNLSSIECGKNGIATTPFREWHNRPAFTLFSVLP